MSGSVGQQRGDSVSPEDKSEKNIPWERAPAHGAAQPQLTVAGIEVWRWPPNMCCTTV